MKRIGIAWVLLCVLLCGCMAGLAQEEEAIPEGFLRITDIKLEDMTTLGDIIAQTDTGEEVILPFPDTWFDGAELEGLTMSGSINISSEGGQMVFKLGDTLLKGTYLFDGEERILPLGIGTTLPYEKQGDTILLSWAEQSQEMLDRLAFQEAGDETEEETEEPAEEPAS